MGEGAVLTVEGSPEQEWKYPHLRIVRTGATAWGPWAIKRGWNPTKEVLTYLPKTLWISMQPRGAILSFSKF